MKPFRFRFTDEADVARFGDRWYVYDETAIVRMPARQQARLEAALGGLKLVRVMTEFAEDGVMGRLAATWIGVHLAAPDLAGDFDKYEPLVFLVHFEQILDEPQEDVAVPLDPTPSESSPTSPTTV
ncbi:hypothetical protein [Actinoplanes sp. NPDC049118]|uniref:hypothetical protein n=1 Tax=Actinoplanes sp. NPDC049118 TaxID=3155769 RepID=UPI0033E24D1B